MSEMSFQGGFRAQSNRTQLSVAAHTKLLVPDSVPALLRSSFNDLFGEDISSAVIGVKKKNVSHGPVGREL